MEIVHDEIKTYCRRRHKHKRTVATSGMCTRFVLHHSQCSYVSLALDNVPSQTRIRRQFARTLSTSLQERVGVGLMEQCRRLSTSVDCLALTRRSTSSDSGSSTIQITRSGEGIKLVAPAVVVAGGRLTESNKTVRYE